MTLNSTVTGVASVGKTEAKGAADRVEPDALPVHPAEAEVPDFEGRFVKDADKDIIKLLKGRGRMVSIDKVNHPYPFCWRSDTPLIYRAVPGTFVNVEALKSKLLANNEKTYWVPDFVREKRFHNW